nr:PREDICTED: cephalotocin receptor 2-like isoform X2 [Struthio camelus australis]
MKNFSFPMQDNTHQTESPSPHRFLSLTNKSDPVGRPERDEQLAQVEIAVLGVIFLTASVGNFILILVLWRRRKKLSRICGLFGSPVALLKVQHSPLSCSLVI